MKQRIEFNLLKHSTYSQILLIALALIMLIPCAIKRDIKLQIAVEMSTLNSSKGLCQSSILSINSFSEQAVTKHVRENNHPYTSNSRIQLANNTIEKRLWTVNKSTWHNKPPTYILHQQILI